MGRTLIQALALSVLQMRNRNHEVMVLEHLLLAITFERNGKRILSSCGINIVQLRNQLEQYLTENIPINKHPETQKENIQQSPAVSRVIERTIKRIQQKENVTAEIGDLIVSFFEEEDCWATYFLNQQGLTVEILDNILKNEIPQPPLQHPDTIVISDMSQIASPEDIDELTKAIQHGHKQFIEKRQHHKNENREENHDNESALLLYTVNLIEKAKKGQIDPIIGRKAELHRTLEILSRRKKNNPLFVGDPGTGKTAIAEGLALAIVEENVPEPFLNVKIFTLDMGSLLAGARYRGDFENRIKAVIKELKEIPNAILVIDEIHTIVGAGATSSGSLDASNLLKPILASGEIRCIGSTTHEEFRNHFEKDRALARRFQRIEIKEPSAEDCLKILQGLQKYYEDFHNVNFSKESLEATIDFSVRYMQDRLLPDKAIDILDEVAASIKLNPEIIKKVKEKNQELQTQSKKGKKKTYRPTVTVNDIKKTVASMANIPVASISNNEKTKLRSLNKDLQNKVFGQEDAIETVSNAIWRAKAGLGKENRPEASFLFHGPTGVGKTELAKCLANILQVPFIRFDMSEYMEKHSVSRLIGSPPGYVGFEQSGLLTEAVRQNPHAILLFDEIEKAHPDIYNILLQVMDYATLTDNNGKKADFKHITIIMTTNAGAREMEKSPMGFLDKDKGQASNRSIKAVESTFTPEFRNRLDAIIGFSALKEEQMLPIVEKVAGELFKGLQTKNVELELTNTAKAWLAKKGYDSKLGARPLQRLIRTELEDRLAQEVLFGKLSKGGIAKVVALSPEAEHLDFDFLPIKNNTQQKKTKEDAELKEV